jgi:hypothetical protein
MFRVCCSVKMWPLLYWSITIWELRDRIPVWWTSFFFGTGLWWTSFFFGTGLWWTLLFVTCLDRRKQTSYSRLTRVSVRIHVLSLNDVIHYRAPWPCCRRLTPIFEHPLPAAAPTWRLPVHCSCSSLSEELGRLVEKRVSFNLPYEEPHWITVVWVPSSALVLLILFGEKSLGSA